MSILSSMGIHNIEALKLFDRYHIVGVFLQGSQNYGLDLPNSDVDTKLIVTPTFEDIALNKKPATGTHVLSNNEHLDYKDVRLYIDTFRKQNINFIEILFTDYYNINPLYAFPWSVLVENREAIARYNPWRALKAMFGMAHRNEKLVYHETPDTAHYFKKYGYNPKALCNLMRISTFIEEYYHNSKSYKELLKPDDFNKQILLQVKKGNVNINHASVFYSFSEKKVKQYEDILNYLYKDEFDKDVEEMLVEVQKEIIRISLQYDLEKNEK